jgi:hypothetical protein
MESWFPSWKCRLTVRLEEYGDDGTLTEELPNKKKLQTQIKGKAANRDGATQVVQDPDAPAGVTRWLVQAKTTNADPQRPGGSDDGLTFELGTVQPKKAVWKNTSVRSANELVLDLRYLDIPLDPRCIRSCGVEFYLGTVTADEYSLGIGGKVRERYAGGPDSGEPLNVLPDTYADRNGQQRSNLRFTGWVDTWECEFSEDAEPSVHLDCRDNTTLLIDQDAVAQHAIDDKKPIDQAIAHYLAQYPQYAGLSVEYRPTGATAPSVGASLAKSAFKPHIGPTPAKGGGAAGKLSVWDYLSDMAGCIGHIVYVEGNVIVVAQVRTVTGGEQPQRESDPYRAREYDGVRMQHRTFIYGRNILSYKPARKYGKGVATNVEVRSYDGANKGTLVVRYPEKQDSVATHMLPGAGKGEQRVQVVRVTGITNEDTLKIIAKSAYETIGRNELNIHIKTKALASFGGDNEDPDLLDMRPGDALDLLVSRDVDWNTVNDVEAMLLTQSSAERFLTGLGFSPAFATAYAKCYRSAGFQNTFVVRGFQATCELEDGVSFDIEVMNYITARADVENAADKTAATTAAQHPK